MLNETSVADSSPRNDSNRHEENKGNFVGELNLGATQNDQDV